MSFVLQSGNNLGVASFFLADMEDLKKFSKSQGALEADDLTHWDIGFWSERLRESKYDINEVVLSLSLSLPPTKFLKEHFKNMR